MFPALHAQGRTVVMETHEADLAAHARRRVTLRVGTVESDPMPRAA